MGHSFREEFEFGELLQLKQRGAYRIHRYLGMDRFGKKYHGNIPDKPDPSKSI
jgi:hypothetical protein